MASRQEKYPKTRYLGLGIALALSAVVVTCLVLIASGLNDEETEAAGVAELVKTVAAESGAVTDGYLAGPESAGQVIARSLRDGPEMRTGALTSLLGNLTATHPNIVGSFVGYPDGGFLDVRRDDSLVAGGYRIKEIHISSTGERTVSLTYADAQLIPFETQPDDTDEYDPRARPWFAAVTGEDSVSWSDPYVFFSSQEPGITHSIAVSDGSGGVDAVVGIDVRLIDLNAFLTERLPSENSSATVIAESGEIIAGSNIDIVEGGAVPSVDSDTARLLSAVPGLTANDDSSTPWIDRWEAERTRVLATQPVGSTTDWLLVVAAPEDDFLQDVRTERRQYSIVATIVGVLSTMLFVAAAIWVTNHIESLRRLGPELWFVAVCVGNELRLRHGRSLAKVTSNSTS